MRSCGPPPPFPVPEVFPLKWCPFKASEHSLWVSKYSHRWRAVMERAPQPMKVKSGNRACIGTPKSRCLIETDVGFEVGPCGILFLPLLLYQLWVLESVSSLFLTSTAVCIDWREKHIPHDYRNGDVSPWVVCLFVCVVPHPTFGLSGMAGSWGLLAVFSCSSARLTSRCHRRMRGEEGETHPGICSLTQWHPAVALCHIPCFHSIWQPHCLWLLHIASSQWSPHYVAFSFQGGGGLQPGSPGVYFTLGHLIYVLTPPNLLSHFSTLK